MYPKGYEQVANFELSMSEWGNAVPYTTQTHREARSRRDPQVARYQDYKKWLEWQVEPHIKGIIRKPTHLDLPILHVHAVFKDRRHGDPSNVRKGVEDAIYKQDKYVTGGVTIAYDKDNPRVVITILERVITQKEG